MSLEDVIPNKAQSNKNASHDAKPQTPVASPLVPPRVASPTIHETSTSVTGSNSESEVDLLSCDNVSEEILIESPIMIQPATSMDGLQ